MLDIRQVFHRLQRKLAGGQIPESTVPKLRQGEILLARDLEPILPWNTRTKAGCYHYGRGLCDLSASPFVPGDRVPAMSWRQGATESLVAGDEVLIDLQQGILVRDPDRRDVAMAQVYLVESELHLADPSSCSDARRCSG